MSIVVLPYDPDWSTTYENIRATLWPVVKPWASAIEHVGSTSVPGLAAKPIVDVDVVVGTREKGKGAIRALEGMGYVHLGDLGLVDREAMREPPHAARHNLYVCLEGSEPLANHRLVRDFLRAHPDQAESYGRLKLELARRYPDDLTSYIDGKTDFLLQILEEAGLSDDARRRVEAINRKPAGT